MVNQEPDEDQKTEFVIIENIEGSSIIEEDTYIVQAKSEEKARDLFEKRNSEKDISLIDSVEEMMDNNHKDIQCLH